MLGVTVGGVFGHSICTGIAVVGGRLIAQRISVRTGAIWIFLRISHFACSNLYRRHCIYHFRIVRIIH